MAYLDVTRLRLNLVLSNETPATLIAILKHSKAIAKGICPVVAGIKEFLELPFFHFSNWANVLYGDIKLDSSSPFKITEHNNGQWMLSMASFYFGGVEAIPFLFGLFSPYVIAEQSSIVGSIILNEVAVLDIVFNDFLSVIKNEESTLRFTESSILFHESNRAVTQRLMELNQLSLADVANFMSRKSGREISEVVVKSWMSADSTQDYGVYPQWAFEVFHTGLAEQLNAKFPSIMANEENYHVQGFAVINFMKCRLEEFFK